MSSELTRLRCRGLFTALERTGLPSQRQGNPLPVLRPSPLALGQSVMAPAGYEPVDAYLEADKQLGEGNVADGQNGEQCEREQGIARCISADVDASRLVSIKRTDYEPILVIFLLRISTTVAARSSKHKRQVG